MINPYWELVLLLCLINIIFTVSLNLILGYNGQFALGHAGFLAIGAYASAVLTKVFHWPIWGGIGMAILLSVVAALIIGYPCLRLRGDYLAIATLGFAEIIRIVANALPKEVFGGPTGMKEVYRFKEIVPPEQMNGLGNFIFAVLFAAVFIFLLVWGVWAFANIVHRWLAKWKDGVQWRWATVGVLLVATLAAWKPISGFYSHYFSVFQFDKSFSRDSFDSNQWVLFLLFGLFVIAVTWLIRNYLISIQGRSVVAIREDEIAATNLGINCTWLKLQNFMLGCAFAGLAGALMAHTLTLFRPLDFNFFKSVDVLLMVVLGGMGSMTGSFLGATTITFLPEVLRFIGQWRMVIYSLVLILLMIFRPGGFMGSAELGQLIRLKFLGRSREDSGGA
jgi:ABC-type branched-subunit amino acid transport system permease subunit